MPISASSIDRSSEIYQKLTQDNLKGHVVLYYKNRGDDDWTYLEDLDIDNGVLWGGKVKSSKPGSFLRTPTCKTISFDVVNTEGEYCPESGYAKAGVLRDGTKIKLRGGYLLESAQYPMLTETATLNGTDAYFFHTKYDGGVCLDPDTPAETETYFKDLFATTYDSETYDDSLYTPAGYYVYTFDFLRHGFACPHKLSVTTNFTEGKIYYRNVDNIFTAKEPLGYSTGWTEYGATDGGTQEIFPAVSKKRYFQVAILWDAVDWDPARKVTAISLQYKNYIEWMYNQVYTLEEPKYSDPEAPETPKLECSGYDSFYKALEMDFNFPSLASGYTIDELIKMVVDACGMRYSSDSIDDLSLYGQKTSNPLTKPEPAYTVLERLMELLLRSGSVAYEMYTEYDSTVDDDVLYVKPRPSEYYSPFVMSYEKYQSIAGRTIDRNNLMQRVTVASSSMTASDDALLDSEIGYSTAGNLTLSWSGNKYFKRIKITINSGDPTVTIVSQSATSVVLNITGTFNVDVYIYGAALNGSVPTYYTETLSIGPMIEGRGFTGKIENEFITSQAEANAISAGYIEEYGEPANVLNNLRWPYLNLIFEVNDPAMIWSRLLFEDTIYRIVGINHNWSLSRNPDDGTIFQLQDTGIDYLDQGDIVYDRDQYPISGEPVKWDYGFVWDMGYGVNGTEDDVDTSIYVHDVGEG